MVMVVNSGRWCLVFLGDAGFPDHLKLWLRIHGDEDLPSSLSRIPADYAMRHRERDVK